jgi:hypothetical protein
MEIEAINVPLVNEGTDVWRLVSAERRGAGTFRVRGPIPGEEQRMYPPGDRVVVETFLHFSSRVQLRPDWNSTWTS